MLTGFDSWNQLKKDLSERRSPKFEVRQIWWTAVGMNLGEEANGKNDLFERPVLVFCKLSKTSFLGIPMTSKIKEGSYFYKYQTSERITFLMLHQLRFLSSKRLLRKIGKMGSLQFKEIGELIVGNIMKIEKPARADFSRTPNGEDVTIVANTDLMSSHRN